jgi:hypothetical protein
LYFFTAKNRPLIMTRIFYSIRKIYILAILLLSSILSPAEVTHKILITEFMALNKTTLADADNEYSDWIELYNPGDATIDLTGWYLTDNAAMLSKWTFPSISIEAGEYLLVWASDKNAVISGQLHTNFKLSGSGEYLALVEPDTTMISYEYTPSFPAQQTDRSYGLYLGQQTYFKTPTPGAGNSIGTQILSPVFSVKHGFFSEPFSVSLSVADASASIYYTTDGTRPTASTGKKYTAPISITTTTPLSAVCIIDGVSSSVISNTYIFTKDVVNQPAAPAGYPTGWGTLQYALYNSGLAAGKRAPADYEMDPDICNSTAYKGLMDQALTSIPTLSIVTNPGYLFSYSIDPDTGGIYIYTGDVAKDSYNTTNTKLGADWERPASVEYFDLADSSNFQINCGLRLHGGNSRKSYNTPKHSLRLSFRSDYGASKLNFDLFDEKKAATRFDHLVVRSPLSGSWLHNNATYRTKSQLIPECFAKKLQLEMGQIAGHDKAIQVYLNGLYWGVYFLTEKCNNDFVAAYAEGDDSQFDVINDDYHTATPANGIVDGNDTAYSKMMTYATASNYDKLISEKLLDCVNYIDYMLMNYYIGNQDWDGNNFFAARNRVTPENGFRYFSWDAETSLLDVDYNLVAVVDKTLTKMFKNLSKNAEFKLLVADRIQKHFFNDGALTPEHTIALYEELAQKIDTAIIAESARWGDYGRDVAVYNSPELYTYNDHWLPRKNDLINNYFPTRTTIVYNQFYTAGYIPTVSAPVYNTLGGKITDPIDVTITADAGTIYYTIDDTDPRLSGGSVNSTALTYSKALHVVGKGTITARAKSGSVWSPVNEVSFKSADTLHFIGEGTGLFATPLQIPIDIFFADNALHYQLPTSGTVRADLYSIDGRLVESFQPEEQTSGLQSINIQNGILSAGIYLYKLKFNDQMLTGKFIVR